MTAIFSTGGDDSAIYRWWLERDVQPQGIVAALVGVNPSTAGATVNDQTIRKDLGFARIHGWRRIIKVNKFAFRATDVRELATASDPIGNECDEHIRRAFAEADVIVPCWGPLAKLPKRLRRRYAEVCLMAERSGKSIMCLGVAQDGHPRHPLTLAYDTPLIEWKRP